MSKNINRRNFLKKSLMISTGVAAGLSLEEQTLLAQTKAGSATGPATGSEPGLPMGQIGKVKISRLICGGNLTNGYAHARDLIYTSTLLKNYFTTEKIIETYQLCEENGINTCIANNNPNENTSKVLKKYWEERGGQIQWIAQCNPRSKDLTTNIIQAIDAGAVGAFIQGGIGDRWIENERVDLIGEVVSFIKSNGLIAGVGGHSIEVPMAVEKAGIKPDFYMKTLHHGNYWSVSPEPEKERPRFGVGRGHDNIWALHPTETIAFMEKVKTPWIAYKTLAAGAIHPRDGFKYAFNSGADFIVAGMFDFQIREDAILARNMLAGELDRTRLWRA